MRPIAERLGTSIEAASEACIRVATSNMVARTLPYLAGHGVAARDLALVAYGGAGAIHGPLLAEEIGVNTVLVPRLPRSDERRVGKAGVSTCSFRWSPAH